MLRKSSSPLLVRLFLSWMLPAAIASAQTPAAPPAITVINFNSSLLQLLQGIGIVASGDAPAHVQVWINDVQGNGTVGYNVTVGTSSVLCAISTIPYYGANVQTVCNVMGTFPIGTPVSVQRVTPAGTAAGGTVPN
jgi:hypothetical protein